MVKAYFMKETDEWKTPKKIFDHIIEQDFIDCFPYKSEKDEFKNNYYRKKLYINPPFSKLKEVIEWIIRQYKLENEILLLMPARTDTQYFHKLIKEIKPHIYFIEGRLHFNDLKSAPFPTMLLHFKKRNKKQTHELITQNQILEKIF